MINFSHTSGSVRHGVLRRAFLNVTLVAAALLLAGSGPVSAQQAAPPLVIEMFTSQGCSSCPPADRLMGQLARKPGVVALTMPVDYWDYIGWKDTFASPAFTARQKGYASARGDSQVYTPQAIIDGMYHVIGSDLAAIQRAAAQAAGNGAMKVSMQASEQGNKVICDVGHAVAGAPKSAGLYLYRILKSRQVKIGRGENRGRSVTYVNIVRSVERVGEWDGKAKQITIPAGVLKKDDAEGWVLLLQAGSGRVPGTILAAAKAKGF